MKTVEVVIRLPKKVYEAIQQIDRIILGRRNGKTIEFALWNGVKNGVVLPKGHGDLKDVAEIERLWQKGDYDSIASALIFAPTVIKADEEKTEEVEND